MGEFGVVPHRSTLRIDKFEATVPESELQDFKQLLRLSKIAPKTYENLQEDRRFGVTHKWMSDTKQHWESVYDWRKTEAYINSFPNFITPINDDDGQNFNVHLTALFSHKADAVPLVFLHGWPGSFLEFLGILDILKKKYRPQDLPFHVVVPSLPGYGYSSGPPLDRDWNTNDIARIVNKLMVGLGFGSGYVAQGGDIGAGVARILGVDYPSCKAVHLNFMILPRPADIPQEVVSEAEQKSLDRGADFQALVALLAWIGEKFQQWTDQDPSVDAILDSVTLYWFTQSFPRCIYPYRQFVVQNRSFHADPHYKIKKPTGFSWFPMELAPTPKAWAEQTINLKLWKAHDSGGHFAAMEKPDVLLEDVQEFINKVW